MIANGLSSLPLSVLAFVTKWPVLLGIHSFTWAYISPETLGLYLTSSLVAIGAGGGMGYAMWMDRVGKAKDKRDREYNEAHRDLFMTKIDELTRKLDEAAAERHKMLLQQEETARLLAVATAERDKFQADMFAVAMRVLERGEILKTNPGTTKP